MISKQSIRAGLGAILVVVLSASVAHATLGPIDALGWTWADSDEVGVDTNFETPLSFTPLGPTLADDGVYTVTLGFPFTLYGQTSNTLYFSTNGWFSLQDPAGFSAPANADIPDPSAPNALLAYYWNDHDSGLAGSLAQHGPTANGHLFLVRHIEKGTGLLFQAYIQFYNNNSVKVIFVTAPNLSSATIGIENQFGGIGNRVAFNGAVPSGANLRGDYAIRFFRAQQPACPTAVALACPGSVNGSSTFGTTAVQSYGCAPGFYSGKESVYVITLTQLTRLDLALTGLGTRDQDVFLLGPNCESTAGCLGGGADAISYPILAPGTYYAVVDGRSPLDDGTHTLTATCSTIDVPIACNTTLPGATGGVSGIHNYSCAGGTYEGGESLFTFSLTAPSTVFANVLSASLLSVFLVDQATLQPVTTPCIAGGNPLVVPILPAGDYELVVDGPVGSSGAFTLGLECRDVPAISCGTTLADAAYGGSVIDYYACFPGNQAGSEKIFPFTLTTTQRVTARVTPSFPFDVIIVDRATLMPTSTACVRGDDDAAAKTLRSGDYAVIVDGPTGTNGNFVVELVCEPEPIAAFPIEFGEVVATCGTRTPPPPGTLPFVFGVIDVRDPGCDPAAQLGLDWPAPMYHNQMPNPTMNLADEWRVENLGQVFGVTLDDRRPPNAYLAASTVYGAITTDPGRVSRIDGVTGAISTFASLPNTGAGLGNLAFDAVHRVLFVTNHEDGKIYGLTTSGAVLDTFDPFFPDDGSAGFAPLGERLWGVGVWAGRVYYAVWSEDSGRQSPSEVNTIWSVDLDVNGRFIRGSQTLEIIATDILASMYSNPVSDIAFSDDGRVMLAERTMGSDSGSGAHQSRALEYQGGHLAWTPSPATFALGMFSAGANSAGGATYGCVDPLGCDTTPRVWVTGDYVSVTPEGVVYGMLGLPQAGGDSSNSYAVDFDGTFTVGVKTLIGDVEMYRSCCVSPPTAAPLPVAAICSGAMVTLDGSPSTGCPGGMEYSWSQGASVLCGWSSTPSCDVSPTLTTDYTLEVRCIGVPGCLAASVITVPVLPFPIADLTTTPTICPGASILLDASGSNPNGCASGLEYQFRDATSILQAWSSASTLGPLTPIATTTYTVEVRCGTCENSAPATVIVEPQPIARAAGSTLICLGDTARLDGAGSSGCPGASEYRWLDGATVLCNWSGLSTCDVSPLAATTYTLEVRCVGGICPASTTHSIDVATSPIAAVSPDVSVCAMTPVQLDASSSSGGGCPSGVEYQWFAGATPVSLRSPVATFTPPTITPGSVTYTVVVSCVGLPSCSDATDVVVSVRDCSLAVHFDSIEAVRVASGTVEVRFTTASEEGSVLFSIGRSVADGDFTEIGQLPARGGGSSYAFQDDVTGVPGRLRYRVIEYTFAGIGDTSPIVEVLDPNRPHRVGGRRRGAKR